MLYTNEIQKWRSDIVSQILEAANGGVGGATNNTKIMYKAYFCHARR
jgi:hypothetical protein